MLHLIEIRFNRNVCDEVMETAWSTMWNVTGIYSVLMSFVLIIKNFLIKR